MDENRFSPRAQRALELAERSAGDLGHSYIGFWAFFGKRRASPAAFWRNRA